MKLSSKQLSTLAAIAKKELVMGSETDESKGQVFVEDAQQLVTLGLARIVFEDVYVMVHITAVGRTVLNESIS